MLTLSNGLSFLRAPLAFLFLIPNASVRLGAVVLAMITDSIDGYLARRSGTVTRFGAILDPAMDKFFVFFALTVLLLEGKVELWQACVMISRDFFLVIFGLYLAIGGYWKEYEFQSIRWGKASTALQFFVLMGLTLSYTFSWMIYAVFILFGTLAFIELWQLKKKIAPKGVLSRRGKSGRQPTASDLESL